MKKIILFTLTALFCLPAFAQRLKVRTYNQPLSYLKHYTHNIESAEVNDSLNIYILGNYTDKGETNYEITGHKINNMTLRVNKKGYPDVSTQNVHLTDFDLYPSSELRYGYGTGIYYPNGYKDYGYPFLGVYDKYTLDIVSFDYYDLSYGGNDTTHAVGLRVEYSPDAGAYYICGTMVNKRFGDIDITDIRAKSKGFIMKIDEAGQVGPRVLVFDPDSVAGDTWLNVVSDIEINANETEIAFTGLDTEDSLTGYLHTMAGVVDMGLTIDWCKTYEITTDKYAGTDVVFNDDDTSLFVLMNSTGTDCSIMELDSDDGTVVQSPWAYDFSGNSTSNDTTRAHMMHYFNDTLIITGNHFATENSTRYQYLFRFDVDANSLRTFNKHFTYYSKQEVPAGDQKYAYSYWTPENSVYKENNLHMVGVYNEVYSTDYNFGFKYVSVNGISSSCVDTLSPETDTPNLDDIISRIGDIEGCEEISVDDQHTDIYPSDTLECANKSASILSIENEQLTDYDLCRIGNISHDGIEAVLISDKPTMYRISIHDVLGREVFKSAYPVDEGETNIKLDFRVQPLVYIVRVSDGKNTEVEKIIRALR